MEINYELLRTFVIAARARTFGAAAAVRRVSVSAISQQVKALETQLGVPLPAARSHSSHAAHDKENIGEQQQ